MASATDLGAIRKEGAFSSVDAESIENAESRERKVTLRMPNDVTTADARNVTTSLVDPKTNTYVTIPAGSVIHKVEIRKVKSTDLDSSLTFTLGFSCTFIQDSSRKATLATRILGTTNPGQGVLLNQHTVQIFDQSLYATAVAAQNTLYDAEMAAQSLPARPAVDYDNVSGNTHVGESRPLIPVCTVLTGNLLASDIEFSFFYTSP